MRRYPVSLLLAGMGLLMGAADGRSAAREVHIGSKKFTESYVLGEIARILLERQTVDVVHHQGMGGTIVLWRALKNGQIALYPEYTGTIREQILKESSISGIEAIRQALVSQGIGVSEALGFNNTYALVMRREHARRLDIEAISDLREHPELTVGLTHEFMNRNDGWHPLTNRYNLTMTDVRTVDHALGYTALRDGTIDVKDAYSTDAKIADYNLTVLEDDRNFFPAYQAVFLYRTNLASRVKRAINGLGGRIDSTMMTRLNAKAERTDDYTEAAMAFFGRESSHASYAEGRLDWVRPIPSRTLEHLYLVGISMAAAVVVGIPLGIIASYPGWLGNGVLGAAGVVQTIPSLALLAILVSIPFLGISPLTAILALFLYSLLPIVRNTASGLQSLPRSIRESAIALGLDWRTRLLKVELPMASATILAGVKTSAVINVGTATLAALIGAGGLGQPIISGLNLNAPGTILQGAVPAALLAILIQGLFVILDRLLIPKGLQVERMGLNSFLENK